MRNSQLMVEVRNHPVMVTVLIFCFLAAEGYLVWRALS